MRRAARKDDNQDAIIEALEAIGCTVEKLHAVGNGCPDILIGIKGFNLMAEIKDGDKVPSQQKLRPLQEKWHGEWKGQAAVVKSPAEAIQLVCRAIQELKT